jgi:hypothetical protein
MSHEIDDYRREFLAKLNEALRAEGFTEVEIAKIDTVVRRALDL